MKFFRKPIAAILIAVIVVTGATLVNTKVRLGNACQRIEDSFFQSEDGSKAPAYYINSRISDAAALASIGSHYPELTEATEKLRDARSYLAHNYEYANIWGMDYSNQDLNEAIVEFEWAVRDVELSPEDEAFYEDCMTSLEGAQRHLESDSSYNEEVRRFRREVFDRFPASELADMAGVWAPELFGVH